MSGAAGTVAAILPALRQILYDEEFRSAVARAQRAFLSQFRIAADGQAAERAADAIVQLAR
jgi:hypothetical protein